jgi:hypothetical protein
MERERTAATTLSNVMPKLVLYTCLHTDLEKASNSSCVCWRGLGFSTGRREDGRSGGVPCSVVFFISGFEGRSRRCCLSCETGSLDGA